MERLIIIFLCVVISSCNFLKPEVKTEYVKVYIQVPVVPPTPPVYPKVDLPLFHLSQSVKPKEVSEAYYNSILILKGELDKRDIDLDVYRDFKIIPNEESKNVVK